MPLLFALNGKALYLYRPDSKKPDQTNDDQVERDNIVQQPRNQQNQNACDQRDYRANAYGKVHGASFLDVPAFCITCTNMQ